MLLAAFASEASCFVPPSRSAAAFSTQLASTTADEATNNKNVAQTEDTSREKVMTFSYDMSLEEKYEKPTYPELEMAFREIRESTTSLSSDPAWEVYRAVPSRPSTGRKSLFSRVILRSVDRLTPSLACTMEGSTALRSDRPFLRGWTDLVSTRCE